VFEGVLLIPVAQDLCVWENILYFGTQFIVFFCKILKLR
jgi:hypothetical protein